MPPSYHTLSEPPQGPCFADPMREPQQDRPPNTPSQWSLGLSIAAVVLLVTVSAGLPAAGPESALHLLTWLPTGAGRHPRPAPGPPAGAGAAAPGAPGPAWSRSLRTIALTWAAGEAAYQALARLLSRPKWAHVVRDNARHLSYEIVGTAFCLYFTIVGGCLWLSPDLPVVLPDRIYGYWEPVQALLRAHVAYQLWNVAVSLRLPPLRKAENLLHHGLAALAAALALLPYGHYYAPFFVGLSEVTGAFLFAVDLFKLLPPLREAYPAANLAARALFALAHLVVRVGYWPVVAWGMLRDNVRVVAAGDVRWPLVTGCNIGGNVVLTALQLYWGVLIVRMALRTLRAQRAAPDPGLAPGEPGWDKAPSEGAQAL